MDVDIIFVNDKSLFAFSKQDISDPLLTFSKASIFQKEEKLL